MHSSLPKQPLVVTLSADIPPRPVPVQRIMLKFQTQRIILQGMRCPTHHKDMWIEACNVDCRCWMPWPRSPSTQSFCTTV